MTDFVAGMKGVPRLLMLILLCRWDALLARLVDVYTALQGADWLLGLALSDARAGSQAWLLSACLRAEASSSLLSSSCGACPLTAGRELLMASA